jgi:hypothetical protein
MSDPSAAASAAPIFLEVGVEPGKDAIQHFRIG